MGCYLEVLCLCKGLSGSNLECLCEELGGWYFQEMMDSCFILSAKILVIRRQYYWEKVIPEKLVEVPEVLEVHVVPSDEVRMLPDFELVFTSPTAMKILLP